MRQPFTALIQYIKRSPVLKLALKIGLTLGALWLVFKEIDFSQLDRIFDRQDVTILYIPLLLLTVQMVISAIRWQAILHLLGKAHAKVFHIGRALRIYYIGMFFNCCLPGGTVGGDAIRIWLTKSQNIPLSLSVHSVIIDRIVALAALGLMVLMALPVLGHMRGFNGFMLIVPIVLLLMVVLWLLFNAERFLKRYSDRHVVHQLIYFLTNVRSLLASPKICLLVLSYAVIGHVLFCISQSFIALSLDIELGWRNSLVLIPPVILIATLPISIGGWGVRELAMIAMLGMIGIGQEEALIISLEAGLMQMATGLPGGLLWLIHRRDHKNQPVPDKAMTGESSS
jgi:glycosyltransferase 2 family protein